MARQRKCTDEHIVAAVQSTLSMRAAAKYLNMHFNSFKVHALRLGVWCPNPSGKGMPASDVEREAKQDRTIPLEEILDGKHPQYNTNNLRKRLIRDGVKKAKCELCGCDESGVSLTLDHINGINNDHRLSNLQILCPNCHSATDTFAGRNKGSGKRINNDADLVMVQAIIDGKSNRELLLELGYTPNGVNYRRVDKLRKIVDFIKQMQ